MVQSLAHSIGIQSFSVVRRGYDTAEVDAYLERLATTVRQLEGELSATGRRLAELERRALDQREAAGLVQSAFLEATEAKNRIIERAERQAEELLRRAGAQLRSGEHTHQGDGDRGQEAAAVLAQARRLLEDAETEAAMVRGQAEQEAAAIVASARSSADDTVATARRDALAAVEESRREAHRLLTETTRQHEALVMRVRELRDQVVSMLDRAAVEGGELQRVLDEPATA